MMRSLKGFLRRSLGQIILFGSLWRMCKSVPVSVEDGGGVATEQRYLVGELAALVEGDDGEGATTAGLPVDGQVLGVGLGCRTRQGQYVTTVEGRGYRQ